MSSFPRSVAPMNSLEVHSYETNPYKVQQQCLRQGIHTLGAASGIDIQVQEPKCGAASDAVSGVQRSFGASETLSNSDGYEDYFYGPSSSPESVNTQSVLSSPDVDNGSLTDFGHVQRPPWPIDMQSDSAYTSDHEGRTYTITEHPPYYQHSVVIVDKVPQAYDYLMEFYATSPSPVMYSYDPIVPSPLDHNIEVRSSQSASYMQTTQPQPSNSPPSLDSLCSTLYDHYGYSSMVTEAREHSPEQNSSTHNVANELPPYPPPSHHQPVPASSRSTYSELSANIPFFISTSRPTPVTHSPSHSVSSTPFDDLRAAQSLPRPLTPSTISQYSPISVVAGGQSPGSFNKCQDNQQLIPLLGPDASPPIPPKLSAIKKKMEKKPNLACLFCRERKIACGRPSEDSRDRTCNQCARRHFKCEYPTESRRGQHRRIARRRAHEVNDAK